MALIDLIHTLTIIAEAAEGAAEDRFETIDPVAFAEATSMRARHALAHGASDEAGDD